MTIPKFEFMCIGGKGSTKIFRLKNVSSANVSQMRAEAFDLIKLDGDRQNLFLSDIEIPTSLGPNESGEFMYDHKNFSERVSLSKEFRLVFTAVDEYYHKYRCLATKNVDNPQGELNMLGEWNTIVSFLKEENSEDTSVEKPTVFISYNWGSNEIADQIEERLSTTATVLRDKTSIAAWGSIVDYMKKIRETDLVVVIVSENYLKSTTCLYEIMQLCKDDNWISHSMFIVEESAKEIYKPIGRLKYIKYWEDERNQLKEALDGFDPALITAQAEDLKEIEMIQLNINDFMKDVAKRNNPELEKAIDAVEQRVLSSYPGN